MCHYLRVHIALSQLIFSEIMYQSRTYTKFSLNKVDQLIFHYCHSLFFPHLHKMHRKKQLQYYTSSLAKSTLQTWSP